MSDTPESPFLTDAEVERLTGSAQPATQARVLADMGLVVRPNRANRVIVAREAIVRLQLGERPEGRKREPRLRLRTS